MTKRLDLEAQKEYRDEEAQIFARGINEVSNWSAFTKTLPAFREQSFGILVIVQVVRQRMVSIIYTHAELHEGLDNHHAHPLGCRGPVIAYTLAYVLNAPKCWFGRNARSDKC